MLEDLLKNVLSKRIQASNLKKGKCIKILCLKTLFSIKPTNRITF